MSQFAIRYVALAAAAVGVVSATAATKHAPQVLLSGKYAKVEDDEGTGIFVIGTENAIFVKLGNAGRREMAWDAERKRVRISALDRKAYWIQCIYLKAIPGHCTGGLRVDTLPKGHGDRLAYGTAGGRRSTASARPSGRVDSGATPGRGLPQCPGDPRCP